MNEQRNAVQPNGHDTQPFAQRLDDAAPDRAAGKFVYAGGSRPLSGFTIKRGVGAGGFGEIYFAVSDAGKEVALKLIQRHLDVELRGIRQCLNLKHPNLVALYDVRQDDRENWWVVMEYVSGRNLQDVVADYPRGMPIDQVLCWIHGVGAGVAYLHDRGIVHRDLKPANIFCDEGLMKVGDYGLSKFISCSQRSGHTDSIGTVHYMAPEVANGRYGKEIDIYALGIILYEMLTGRVPFDGESVGEVLMKHLTAQPDLSMLAEPYRGIVGRAMEKDPARRFATVNEMLAGLPRPGMESPGAAAMPPVGAPAGSSSPPEQVVIAELVDKSDDEEPIWQAVRQGWRRVRRRWDNSGWKRSKKASVLACIGVIAAVSVGAWMPLLIAALVLYGMYRVVRAVVLLFCLALPAPVASCRGMYNPRYPQSPVPPGFARPAAARPVDPPSPQTALPLTARLAEIVGSLLYGALAAMATAAIALAVFSRWWEINVRLEQGAWLFAVSLTTTWVVLLATRLRERRQGSAIPRVWQRLTLGAGVGLVACGLAQYLLLRLPLDGRSAAILPPANFHMPNGWYAADGEPLAMAYAACFATLFVFAGWWRQADPARLRRFRLGSVIVSMIMACVVASLWRFPQPWLMVIAVATSVAVQAASSWVGRKRQFAEQQ